MSLSMVANPETIALPGRMATPERTAAAYGVVEAGRVTPGRGG